MSVLTSALPMLHPTAAPLSRFVLVCVVTHNPVPRAVAELLVASQ